MSEAQLSQLRELAREIFNAALRAVDVRGLTNRAIQVHSNQIQVGNTSIAADKNIYVVSLGKAAASMALALHESLEGRVAGGVVTSRDKATEILPRSWLRFAGGHPVPNSDSIAAAQAAMSLVRRANVEAASVIFAVSGGGSAMFESPINTEISLTDLQEANRLLVSCGASIAEVNIVRQAFSAVKGGRLAGLVTAAQAVTLIVSDTNPGDESAVAAGPSLTPSQQQSAADVVARYHLESTLPQPILSAIKQSQLPENPSRRAEYVVLADNGTATHAAAKRAKEFGFEPVMCDDISEQPIESGCELLVARLKAQRSPACLLSGGEFSCPVRGDGIGGRNSETVLRIAHAIKGQVDHTVVLSAGTDGIDGNSLAAGAIADETTSIRAREIGLDATDFLARSDSYSFFERLGDAILTGSTGTNVRDVRLLLKGGSTI